MYRRLTLYDSRNDRTGWAITLRKDRFGETESRKTVKALLFTALGLKKEVIDRLRIGMICTHISDKTPMGNTELFLVKFDETISLKLSKRAEVKAASQKEIEKMIEKDPYSFTYETREIMNVFFTLGNEPSTTEKEKANGS